jgi:hypothetical protein
MKNDSGELCIKYKDHLFEIRMFVLSIRVGMLQQRISLVFGRWWHDETLQCEPLTLS